MGCPGRAAGGTIHSQRRSAGTLGKRHPLLLFYRQLSVNRRWEMLTRVQRLLMLLMMMLLLLLSRMVGQVHGRPRGGGESERDIGLDGGKRQGRMRRQLIMRMRSMRRMMELRTEIR